ncbi:MAG: kynureninase [Gammaproteobacteria bacterium]
MNFDSSRNFAVQLDAQDPLKHYRERFFMPKTMEGAEKIYFCGNSLGLQPRASAERVQEVLERWAQHAVEGHFSGTHPWLPYHEFFSEKLARLLGARPSEVVAMNSLTVNLHLMMVSFYRPDAERYKILIESQAFPSDRYAVLSQINFHGLDPADALIQAATRPGEQVLRSEDLLEWIEREGRNIALILLPGVQYYTGQFLDCAAITECGHRKGCTVGFDLAHAVGNLPLRLHDWQVDFAVWCSYKYLNAGPGAIGGCFVHERHGRHFQGPRFTGWWGHDKSSRFQMPDQFVALTGAEGWQLSNPPILSSAPLLASLDLFDEAGMAALRAKSEKLTAYLEFLLRSRCGSKVSVITPTASAERGCQLSLQLKQSPEENKRTHQKLLDREFVCDWREPDVIRVAPVPLYNRFAEVFDFVECLKSLL